MMTLSLRQQRILNLIEDHQRVRVDDLAAQFSTTPQTIRKDLQRLAELHHIVRFHGGATLIGGVEYTSLTMRASVAFEQKQAIGAAVANLVPMNCAIFLNAGSTTQHVAKMLATHTQLRMITDNVDIASNTRSYAGVEVVVPGGVVRRKDGAILGAEAVDYIRQFRVDYAVIGAAAISEDGAMFDYDLAEVQVCRAMMAGARHTILALDSSKFTRAAPVRLGDLGNVNTIVTDEALPNWVVPLCKAKDVDLIIAKTQ